MTPPAPPRDGFLAILAIFLRLGLTSFGGPVAHLGYFRAEFVTRRQWLSEAAYGELVALAQFLPGPASSQTGFALGLMRGGLPGGIAAWIGFSLPSAVAMVLAAYGVGVLAGSGVVHGLKLVAVAVVAQAVWGMAGSLAPDRVRATIAVGAAAAVLLLPSAVTQLGVILAGAGLGLGLFRDMPAPAAAGMTFGIGRRAGAVALVVFVVLLLGLPLLSGLGHGWALAEAAYRAGALVFGGGHVVLPLLEQSFVPSGWVPSDAFLAGYAAAQAVPGPLFTFAAFLGAADSGVAGAVVAMVAVFLPGLLLMFGTLPFWDALRLVPAMQAALRGVNAAVVGVLLAALYDPIWVAAVRGPADFAIVLAAFVALVLWRAPVVAVVAATTAAGALVSVS